MKTTWLATVSALLLVMASAAGIGAVHIHPADVLWALLGQPVDPLHEAVLWTLRVPRVLLAAFVGGGLGLSGALTQGLFRNPLADPGLIGVSAGAALSVAIATVLFDAGPTAKAVSAFAGAVAVVGGVLKVGKMDGEMRIGVLLLAGVAVNAIAMAAVGLLLWLADDAALRSYTFWTMGSLSGATWPGVGLVGGVVGLSSIAALQMHGPLDACLLGDDAAAHLGVRVQRVRQSVVGLVALSVGVGVALAGMIGFIGLVIPHLVRLGLGPSHRVVLPGSLLLGALLLIIADTTARTAAAPAELPVGLLTTLFGGPFFFALLRRYRGAL